jgi:hypothetical protein
MANFFVNKINTDLDNYYLNPRKFKFNDTNIDNICFDGNNDLNEIIQTLTSIIMSNNNKNCINSSKDYLNDDKINFNSPDIFKSLKITDDQKNNDDCELFKLIANDDMEKLNFVLKNKNLNINVQDNDGDTLLHISVFLCNHMACEILLKNNAFINLKDKWGQIPIHRICFCSSEINSIKIIKLFDNYQKKNKLNYNIFNFIDNFGNTPFHLVLNYLIKNNIKISNNHIKIINKLKILTNNNITNKDNQSTIDLLTKLNL